MSDAIKGLFGGGKDEDNDPDEKIKKIGLDPGHAKSFVNRYLDGDPSEGYDKDEAAESFREGGQERLPRADGTGHPPGTGEHEPWPALRLRQDARAAPGRGGGNVPIQQAGDRSAGGGASGGDMGIDDILGGLLGGASGGGGGGGGGLGDLFGSLLGGGGQIAGWPGRRARRPAAATTTIPPTRKPGRSPAAAAACSAASATCWARRRARRSSAESPPTA